MAPPEPLDELAAGSVWRAHKLNSFKQRALALGVADDPAVQDALRCVQEHTEVLEALRVQQADGTAPRRWWEDGEYDDERADAANDAGLALLSRKELRNAYDAFTEAIRLSPRKAAYHANRAAVALQLANMAGAAEDAEEAVRLSPEHVAAHMRAAKAHLALRQPLKALQHYEQVLALKPAHEAARRGMAEANALTSQQRSDSERGAAAALRGDRPPLPQQRLVSAEDAAEQLLDAEAMLRAHPGMDGVISAHVEALIMCRKYDVALKACTASLVSRSLDALYLKAEAQWRAGSPDEAMETLQAARLDENAACKCGSLVAFLRQLLAAVAAGDAAAAKASAESAVAAYSTVLAMAPVEGTHMQARVLCRRAEAHETLRDYASALADLDAAVALDASDIDALRQRAGVHRAAGDLERCFLDVRAARILDPQRPGVVQAEQAAAQAALRRGVRAPSSAARQGPPGGTDACNLPRSYQVLGVGMSATQRDFTRQYRKLASKWHPDKWATATPEEQKVAEHRFRVIADAYETLRDPERRAKHDRDFYFTART